jgi:hypothetical protein
MVTTAELLLLEGVAVLEPVLAPHGFAFRQGPSGRGSGGQFSSCRFERGDRVLELHFRHGLGLVAYRIGAAELDHEHYLRRTGNWANRRYPDFSASPIDSFRALAHDLGAFCTDFLGGTGEQFKTAAAAHAANPNEFKGFAALGKQ